MGAGVLMLAFTITTFWYDFACHSTHSLVGACIGAVRVVHAEDRVRPWGAHVEPIGPLGKHDIIRWSLAPGWSSMPGAWWVYVPLWPFVLLPALVAGWLWRRERLPGPGHCQRCGYNLRGNVSGVCPECGVTI